MFSSSAYVWVCYINKMLHITTGRCWHEYALYWQGMLWSNGCYTNILLRFSGYL